MKETKEEKLHKQVARILGTIRSRVTILESETKESATVVICKYQGWKRKIVIPSCGLPIVSLIL